MLICYEKFCYVQTIRIEGLALPETESLSLMI